MDMGLGPRQRALHPGGGKSNNVDSIESMPGTRPCGNKLRRGLQKGLICSYNAAPPTVQKQSGTASNEISNIQTKKLTRN